MDISKKTSLKNLLSIYFLILVLFCKHLVSSYKYSPKQARCEPIEISLCETMRYNMTRMPNSFGHSNQREAAEAIDEFLPLIRVGCSKLLRFFLCSRFVPICSEQDGDSFIVPPCKSFCMQVKAGCAPVLAKLSFNWPPSLDCQNLPVSSDTYNVCVEPPNEHDYDERLRKHDFFEDEKTLWKKTKDESDVLKEFDWLLGQISKIPPESKCESPRYVEVSSTKDSECVPKCSTDVLFSHKDKEFIKTWLTIWSMVSVFSCAFTILSYLSKASDLKYPEKPALYVAMCCAFESATYAARLLVDEHQSHCSSDRRLLMTSDVSNWMCTSFAVVLYYFDIAGLVWWVLLSISWFLAAVRKWGQEAIASLGLFFHLIAWVVPGFAAGAMVATKNVEGDELLGMCRVSSRRSNPILMYSISPLVAALAVGSFFTFIGFVSVFKILKQLKVSFNMDDATRLERLIFRMGIFSVLYITTTTSQLTCYFIKFASVEEWVQESINKPCLPGWEKETQNCRLEKSIIPTELYLVQVFASLSVGVTTTVWVWSRKTLINWGRLLTDFWSKVFRCKKTKENRNKSSSLLEARISSGDGTPSKVHPQKNTAAPNAISSAQIHSNK